VLRLEHLWVLPDWMGQGIGRALFRHAAERAAARGALSLTIEADPNAEPFYLPHGCSSERRDRDRRRGTPPGICPS
jgi:GNAT superfamily N-acetyltransferase